MANIKDVAKLAGVSVTTVSRTFNNRGYISQETREKIEKACKELNYQPNEIARSLFKKKSNMIGVLIPRLDSFFFSELLQHIEGLLYEKGYKLLLCSTNNDTEKERSYLNMFKAQKVDGVIIASYLTEDDYDYSNIGMPAVAFDRYLKGGIQCIGSDHHDIGLKATKELIDKGCKKLAHFRGHSVISSPTHDKTSAFIEVCKEAAVDYLVIEKKMHRDTEIDFNGCLQELLKEMPDFDGLFLNDYDATLFLRYAKENGIDVPGDVQIVGYDNIRLSQIANIPITSVAQSFEKLSEAMVDTLIKMINEESVDFEGLNKISVDLIQRKTTKTS